MNTTRYIESNLAKWRDDRCARFHKTDRRRMGFQTALNSFYYESMRAGVLFLQVEDGRGRSDLRWDSPFNGFDPEFRDQMDQMFRRFPIKVFNYEWFSLPRCHVVEFVELLKPIVNCLIERQRLRERERQRLRERAI